MNWISIFTALAAEFATQRDQLNALDSTLGDGDHGTAMSIAFSEIAEKTSLMPDASPSELLKTAAMTLMNRMGGTSGAIFGTLFLRASGSVSGKTTLSTSDVASMWEAGLEGVKQRGKAQVGDKTMVDALAPAVGALRAAADANDSITVALEKAALAARNGAESTRNIVAKQGRARFAGERSLGHVDAGATSIAILFETLLHNQKGQPNG